MNSCILSFYKEGFGRIIGVQIHIKAHILPTDDGDQLRLGYDLQSKGGENLSTHPANDPWWHL